MVFDVDGLEHSGGGLLDEGFGEGNMIDRRVGGGGGVAIG
jgi:hypothetical protein